MHFGALRCCCCEINCESSDTLADLEVSRTTSALTSATNCKFTKFLSVAKPLILRAPPKIIIVAEGTRSYLAISRTNSGFTTSNTRSKPKSHQLTYPVPRAKLVAIFQISSYLGLQWRNRLIPQLRISSDLMGQTGEPVQTPGKPK